MGNNGLANLKQTIDDHNSLWGKSPKEATITECRDFAKKHNLKLPVGVPRSKEAFVAMFTCCRLSNRWEGKKKSFRENFPSLTDEHEKVLFAYRNKLAAVNDVPKKGSHLELVSSLDALELAEYGKRRHHKSNSLPIDPKTGKRFASPKAWRAHNVAATTSLPTNPATNEPFTSEEDWKEHNRKLFAEFKVKKDAGSFEPDLEKALRRSNKS